MSANNARVRRVVLNILWNEGPLTKEAIMDRLSQDNRLQPSNQSLGSILSKSHQIVVSGKSKVLTTTGIKRSRNLFDIDRSWIFSLEELRFTYPLNMMTKTESREAKRCKGCSRVRLIPEGSEKCLSCERRSL
tara:strand:- start:211 stop:609 length:399 start_codon:yes stop_codon:yes gene_type:complete